MLDINIYAKSCQYCSPRYLVTSCVDLNMALRVYQYWFHPLYVEDDILHIFDIEFTACYPLYVDKMVTRLASYKRSLEYILCNIDVKTTCEIFCIIGLLTIVC